MKRNKYLIFFILIISGCKTVNSSGSFDSYSDCINLVIEDYYKIYSDDINKYNFFSVEYEAMSGKGYYLFNVLPMQDNNYSYIVDTVDSRSYLPSYYIEYKTKVFFIEEENRKETTIELLKYLDSCKMLDSTKVKIQLGLLHPKDMTPIKRKSDDLKKGVSYVICKDEPLDIKKRLRSNIYISPDDEMFNVCE
ncbi:hypothetical protein [Flavobacterium sp.]|uniref:hypothetical protein n=1 Tax=Flavobacterium sp. TaxID=239 RepID=UPI003A920C14